MVVVGWSEWIGLKDFDGRSPIYCSYFIFATFSLLQMKMKFLIKTIRVVFIAAKAAPAPVIFFAHFLQETETETASAFACDATAAATDV